MIYCLELIMISDKILWSLKICEWIILPDFNGIAPLVEHLVLHPRYTWFETWLALFWYTLKFTIVLSISVEKFYLHIWFGAFVYTQDEAHSPLFVSYKLQFFNLSYFAGIFMAPYFVSGTNHSILNSSIFVPNVQSTSLVLRYSSIPNTMLYSKFFLENLSYRRK